MKTGARAYLILMLLMLLLFFANILYGAVNVPFSAVLDLVFGKAETDPLWRIIVLEARLPQAVTALLSGAALAVSGLLLQTLFRNPLAGPSILGISDGANLGVALVMLHFGGAVGSLGGYLAIVGSALAGALAVLAVILYFARKVNNNVMLLIIGIMVGYLVSSFISILNYYASADKVQQFVMWGMGDFTSVTMDKLPFYSVLLLSGLVLSLLLIKPLNALLLGERYAANLGMNVRAVRLEILLTTGILTAAVTAFCGPVSFIGLAVPHIARLLLRSANHNRLVPVTLLTGAVIALLCNLLTVIPGSNSVLPLNAVTPLFGAPVIIYVIINRRNLQYFN